MTRRVLLVLGALAVVGALAGCMADSAEDAGSAGSPMEPPTPPPESILPLQVGNRWEYADTYYDSLGTRRGGVTLSLPYAFGYDYGVGFTTIDQYSSAEGHDEYHYEYRWGNQGTSYLVSFSDGAWGPSGVYITGTVTNGVPQLFTTPQQWLHYPAPVGRTWQYTLDSLTWTIEVVATDTTWYFPDELNGSTAPLRFVSPCYVYRETCDSTVAYRILHKDYGLISYRYHDEQGRLARTHVLESFYSGDYYYYY